LPTLIVNLFGAPSAGKSTTAAGLYYHLKSNGINAELTGEYAKDLVYSGRVHELSDQIYIFAKQRKRIERLAEHCDVVISDSPILMGAAYWSHLYPDCFRETLKWSFNEYPSVNFLVRRVYPYRAEGRVQNEEEADQLHRDIRDLIERNDVTYSEITGDHQGLEIAIKTVLANRSTNDPRIKVGDK
jgi:nicotinamide riboside kinase